MMSTPDAASRPWRERVVTRRDLLTLMEFGVVRIRHDELAGTTS